MVRTPCCDQNGMKKGTWTPEEDRKLVAYVTRYGCWNWRQLPKFAGLKRCGKSCRLRWMNYLRPNVKRGNYTQEEEETIIKLHESLGNRWSAIAAQLPGRTDNEVKNHWHTHLKKRVKNNSSTTQKEVESTNSNSNSNVVTFSPNIEDYYQNGELLMEPIIDDNVNPHDESSSSALMSSTIAQILDSSNNNPMSPQTSSSSSEVSTSTTESTITNATESSSNDDNYNMVAESNVGNNDPFEAFSEFSDNFWTEPFLADNSYIPSDFLSSLIDNEFVSSPVFDANLLFTGTTGNYYEENLVELY